MIQLSADTKILLAPSPQDFRKGIDGFAALCRQQLKQDPQSGLIFVFINRSKTMVRLLAYDDNGFWLMTKRLSKGKYINWPSGDQPITTFHAKQLRLLLKNCAVTEAITNQQANKA